MVHVCTICGNEGAWDKSWQQYSSIAIDEHCPQDAIKTCSDECREVFDELRLEGSIKLPNVQVRGGCASLTRSRIGY